MQDAFFCLTSPWIVSWKYGLGKTVGDERLALVILHIIAETRIAMVTRILRVQ